MALDVVRYSSGTVVVHRPECRVWSSARRCRQVEPAVVVSGDWRVVGCEWCRPSFGVVVVDRRRVLSRGEEMLSRFGAREQRRRLVPQELDVPRGRPVADGWERSAGCRSDDERLASWLSWLFTSDSGLRWQTDMQKRVCGECRVRADCLLTGVWGEEPWGVWGGATVQERRVLLRRWRNEGRTDGQLLEVGLAASG